MNESNGSSSSSSSNWKGPSTANNMSSSGNSRGTSSSSSSSSLKNSGQSKEGSETTAELAPIRGKATGIPLSQNEEEKQDPATHSIGSFRPPSQSDEEISQRIPDEKVTRGSRTGMWGGRISLSATTRKLKPPTRAKVMPVGRRVVAEGHHQLSGLAPSPSIVPALAAVLAAAPPNFFEVDDLAVHIAPWNYGDHRDEPPLVELAAAGDIQGPILGEVVNLGVAEDYGVLVGYFHKGAYYKHHSWRELLQPITLDLLRECVNEVEFIATRAIAALQLLPGLVAHCRAQRKQKVWTPIQLLREINGAPNKAEEIIRVARSWVPHLRVLPTD